MSYVTKRTGKIYHEVQEEPEPGFLLTRCGALIASRGAPLEDPPEDGDLCVGCWTTGRKARVLALQREWDAQRVTQEWRGTVADLPGELMALRDQGARIRDISTGRYHYYGYGAQPASYDPTVEVRYHTLSQFDLLVEDETLERKRPS